MLEKAKKFVSDNKDTIANSAAIATVTAVVLTLSYREKKRYNNAIIGTRESMISEIGDHFGKTDK